MTKPFTPAFRAAAIANMEAIYTAATRDDHDPTELRVSAGMLFIAYTVKAGLTMEDALQLIREQWEEGVAAMGASAQRKRGLT